MEPTTIRVPIELQINTSYGDEYTELLNVLRPVGKNEAQAYMAWDLVQRVVNDARRYRTRALIAESESAAARAELLNLQNAVFNITRQFKDELGMLIDDQE